MAVAELGSALLCSLLVPAHTEAVLLETKISLLVAALAIDVVKCNVCNLDGSQLGVANSGVKKHIS